MIIKTQDSEVESSGVMESEEFDIGSKEMVISLIRENIYKEPLLAFIREVAANARDANREVGFHKVPVKITLPNGFDNSIRIRDCGPGLSPERMKIYRGYGLSTKRDSNLQTGGFGLGAKSPFSYTEEFTISSTTLEEGKKVKRTYFAVKEGTGSTNLVDEVLVNDPLEITGTEISVPVKKNDFYRVKDIVKKLFSFWDVKPEIVPSKELLINDPPKILIDDPLFAVVLISNDTPYGGYERKPSIILDGFHYPLNDGNEMPDLFSPELKYLSMGSIIFKFNTGDIDLAVSRDNIRFSKLTIKSVKDRIDYVHQKLRSLIVQKIESAVSLEEAMKLFASLRSCFGSLSYGDGLSAENISNLFAKLYWHNLIVSSQITTTDIGRWCECYYYSKNRKRRNKSTVIVDHGVWQNHHSNKKIFLSLKEEIDSKIISFLFKENPDVDYLCVVCTPAVPSSNLFTEEKNKNPALVVTYDQKLLDALNLPKIEDVKLPIIPKIKKKRVCSDSDYEFLVGRKVSGTKLFLGEPERIPNTGGIYLLLDGNKKTDYIIQGFLEKDIRLNRLSSYMFHFLGEKDIYAFTETRAKHLSTGWVPVGQVLKENLFAEIKDNIIEYNQYLPFDNDDLFYEADKEKFFSLCKKIANETKEFELINRLVDHVGEVKKCMHSFNSLRLTISNIRDWIAVGSDFEKFENELFQNQVYPDKLSFFTRSVCEKYPLIENLTFCSLYRIDIDNVIKYLRCCV